MSSFFLTPKKGTVVWRPLSESKTPQRIHQTKTLQDGYTASGPRLTAYYWLHHWTYRMLIFLHLPVLPDHNKFLRFRYKDITYEFTVLPFGLSTAPRVFTRIVKALGAHLHGQEITTFMYLDDWLVVG